MSSRVLRGGLALLIVCLVVGVFAAAMFDHWHLTGDFEPHSVYIERMQKGDELVFTELPNLLYHASVILPAMLTPQTPFVDWIVPVCVAWTLLLAGLIWWQMRAAVTTNPDSEKRRPATVRGEGVSIVLTLLALLIAPIILLTPDNQYFGYMTPYVYHNPTMIPLRPTAFLLFIGAVSFASAEVVTWKIFDRRRELQVPLLAALTVATILAKPNFIMILVPALVLWLGVLFLMRRHVDTPTVIMGIIVPGIAFLAYQSMNYSGSGMAFNPFYTQFTWAANYDPQANANLGLKILLSILFPLIVSVVYWRQAVKSPMMMLAWIAMIGGILLTYFFYDPGEPPAGNLTWSGQIGALILHLAALLFLVRQHTWLNDGRPRDLLRFGVCAAVLALHILSGVIWYQAHLTGTWPEVIYTVW